MGFNLLTLVIYLSNPFWVNSGYHGLAVVFICISLFFLGWGYKTGLKKGTTIKAIPNKSFLSEINHKTLQLYMVFYVLTFLMKYAYELHCHLFDIGGLVRRIALGISDPYLGYTMSLGETYRPFRWSVYVFICLFDGIFFIVGLLSWKKLKKGEKWLFIILSLIELLKGLGSGSSFGEIKMITTLAVVLLVNLKDVRLTRKQKNTLLLGLVMAFFSAVFIFGYNMSGRSGGEFSDTLGDSLNFNQESFINKYLISHLSKSMQNFYVYICNYLVHGYYNFEYAFAVDYDWTWFFGSNDAKTNMLKIIAGVDVEQYNYQMKILKQFQVDPYVSWHSCYLWLANDVSLFGVPFVLFLVGRYTGFALVLFRRYDDLLSGIICVIFANMVLFLFANNNYIANLFYSFLILFPVWLFTRYISKSLVSN